jgi:hypothetical protein
MTMHMLQNFAQEKLSSHSVLVYCILIMVRSVLKIYSAIFDETHMQKRTYMSTT